MQRIALTKGAKDLDQPTTRRQRDTRWRPIYYALHARYLLWHLFGPDTPGR